MVVSVFPVAAGLHEPDKFGSLRGLEKLRPGSPFLPMVRDAGTGDVVLRARYPRLAQFELLTAYAGRGAGHRVPAAAA